MQFILTYLLILLWKYLNQEYSGQKFTILNSCKAALLCDLNTVQNCARYNQAVQFSILHVQG